MGTDFADSKPNPVDVQAVPPEVADAAGLRIELEIAVSMIGVDRKGRIRKGAKTTLRSAAGLGNEYFAMTKGDQDATIRVFATALAVDLASALQKVLHAAAADSEATEPVSNKLGLWLPPGSGP